MPSKIPLALFSLSFALFGSALHAQTTGPTVRFHTNVGDIDVILTPSVAPLTVANFLSYMNAGVFNNSIFHRSVPGFVIQGGGYQLQSGLPVAIPQNAAVQNEFNVTNARGTIAMAKVDGNPNSATNQWFFNLANNGSQLDGQNGGFTVFGRITNTAGLTIMDRIAALPVGDFSSVYGADFNTLPHSGTNFVTVLSVLPVPSLTAPGFQSAASFASSSLTGISPGEFLVIYGQTLGPADLTTLMLNNGVAATSLAGTQVLFNGVAAPVVYTSAGQISVIAPYNISDFETINVSVVNQGVQSNTLVFPVKPANPAIFTLNSTGTGDGVLVRFPDGGIISGSNPAKAGDILTLYGEGYGAATPDTSLPDGVLVGSKLPVPADPTTWLLIDGQKVDTSYFGGAPSLVNGVLQVNFTVPPLAPGSHQIQLQVGARKSPTGVTLQTK
ncbi:MAG: peptidylprolyl isomerase [Acidobacteriota bacterium]